MLQNANLSISLLTDIAHKFLKERNYSHIAPAQKITIVQNALNPWLHLWIKGVHAQSYPPLLWEITSSAIAPMPPVLERGKQIVEWIRLTEAQLQIGATCTD
jgi:hypothetical protein